MNRIIELMPEMLSGAELRDALTVLPEYDEDVRKEKETVRLLSLSDIYQVYVPTKMSFEIYSKLYLSLLRSVQKKESKLTINQQTENYRRAHGMNYSGIMGGSDSFTIIGSSGIGKSTAIARIISLITKETVIEIERPYCKIIPCVVVQCPFDSSVKGLLFEILRKVDEILDSKYYSNAVRARATVDMLIGAVSQVSLNHIGLLIVDEIQNVANSKNGKALVGMLTQLINNSGISICMVGTPESAVFFEQAMQLARRSLGLQYGALDYEKEFYETCRILFRYQYTKEYVELTEGLVEWLYEHSGGVVAILVSLLHDAQEIAIQNGTEQIGFDVLNEAYQYRHKLLHGYIEIGGGSKAKTRNRPKVIENYDATPDGKNCEDRSIQQMVAEAKEQNIDMVTIMKKYIPITEVAV